MRFDGGKGALGAQELRRSAAAHRKAGEEGEEGAAGEASQALARHVAGCESFSRTVSKVSEPLTAPQREQLRALGYLR